MEKLKAKFAHISHLLFSEETRQTYIQAISLTWTIIRELFTFLWLLFCSTFLIFFWGGNYAYQAGKNLRIWYADMDENQKKNMVGSVAGTVKQSFGFSLGNTPSFVEMAKSQLDIENDPPALKALPAAPKVIVKDEDKNDQEDKKAEKQNEEQLDITATLEEQSGNILSEVQPNEVQPNLDIATLNDDSEPNS